MDVGVFVASLNFRIIIGLEEIWQLKFANAGDGCRWWVQVMVFIDSVNNRRVGNADHV